MSSLIRAWLIAAIVLIASVTPIEAHHGRGSHAPKPPPSSDPCSETLQSRINRTSNGGTLDLPPQCIFRESVEIKQSININGHSEVNGTGAQIRGSDVWTQWNGRTSVNVLPPFPFAQIAPEHRTPTCTDGSHTTCSQPEQVWFDGRWLKRVFGQPGPGEFTLDGGRHVVLGDDPAGHVVEVATRPRWMAIGGSDITIQRITFRHSVGGYPNVALITHGSRRARLYHNSFFEAGFRAISVAGSIDMKIEDNEISWNGGGGAGGASAQNLLISGGQMQYNNMRVAQGQSISDYWRGWDAAGIKVVRGTHTVRGVNIHHNGAVGLWCDIDCSTTTFENNTVRDNLMHGIEWEGSVGPFIIRSNISERNQGCGVMVALNEDLTTARGEVTNNVLPNNTGGPICKGYNNTEVQPGVVYSGNTP